MLGATLVVNNVIANGFSYVNLMVLFRSQLQILNHSVKNIETRVVERYQSKYGTKPDIRKGELETDLSDALKKCYMECLKQNIMHHQALLRLVMDDCTSLNSTTGPAGLNNGTSGGVGNAGWGI